MPRGRGSGPRPNPVPMLARKVIQTLSRSRRKQDEVVSYSNIDYGDAEAMRLARELEAARQEHEDARAAWIEATAPDEG